MSWLKHGPNARLVAAGVEDGLGGEENGGGGAVAGAIGVVVEANGAAVFADDALRDPKAEAGSAFSLGGEEGLEEAFLDLRSDSGPVVGDFNDGPGGPPCRRGGIGCLRDDADGDVAALARGFGGVGDEVGEDLTEFGGVSVDGDRSEEHTSELQSPM